ncbi:MAG: hypothetical protein EA411_12195 [Saprospirales bacterium]|nr:MAG: hypothetical protein EA411_12195 [Saprospirales bacterium]
MEWPHKIVLPQIYFLLTLLIGGASLQAQVTDEDEFYDELSVVLSVENLGSYSINAIYHRDELFLPANDLFSLLEIYIRSNAEQDSFYGYFGDESLPFVFAPEEGFFSFREDSLEVESGMDFILTFEDLFVSLPVYRDLFGLHMEFNFRNLRVFLESEIEPPVVRMLRVEQMRESLRVARGEVRVDTTIIREFNWIGGVVVDLNLRSQQSSTGSRSEVLRTDLGAEFIGGELQLSSFLDRSLDFNLQRQYASWRFVNNDLNFVRQIEMRSGVPNILSRVFDNSLGFRITNTPTTLRRSFGTYLLSRRTEPGWEVELYVNNVLIDETVADASGEFQFEVPLSYGSTDVTLRFYGPWGQEEVEQVTIDIPFSFVPINEIEYSIQGGRTIVDENHLFLHGRVSYGLSRNVTLNAGFETFERNIESRNMPFAGATFSPFPNAMMSYNYVGNSWHEGSVLLRTSGGMYFDAGARIYEEDQDAWRTPNEKELRLGFTTPFTLFDRRFMFRNNARSVDNISGWAHFVDSQLGFFAGRANINLSSRFRMGRLSMANFAVDARLLLGRNWNISANTWYDAEEMEFLYSRILVQRRFGPYFRLSANLNHSFALDQTSISLNAFMDLQFGRVSTGVLATSNTWQTNQNVFTSIQFGGKSHKVSARSRSNLGRGTIDVRLFVDANHNGVRDEGEPLVNQAIVSLSGSSREELIEVDSVFRFYGLELYTNYIINVDKNSLPNISWTIDHEVYSIYPEPNRVRTLEIPVKPMGEIEGRVMMETREGTATPARNVRVIIYDSDGNLVVQLSTDEMGYFFHLGFPPGSYTAQLEPTQLERLNASARQLTIEFELEPSVEGDFIPGLDFVLSPLD